MGVMREENRTGKRELDMEREERRGEREAKREPGRHLGIFAARGLDIDDTAATHVFNLFLFDCDIIKEALALKKSRHNCLPVVCVHCMCERDIENERERVR